MGDSGKCSPCGADGSPCCASVLGPDDRPRDVTTDGPRCKETKLCGQDGLCSVESGNRPGDPCDTQDENSCKALFAHLVCLKGDDPSSEIGVCGCGPLSKGYQCNDNPESVCWGSSGPAPPTPPQPPGPSGPPYNLTDFDNVSQVNCNTKYTGTNQVDMQQCDNPPAGDATIFCGALPQSGDITADDFNKACLAVVNQNVKAKYNGWQTTFKPGSTTGTCVFYTDLSQIDKSCCGDSGSSDDNAFALKIRNTDNCGEP